MSKKTIKELCELTKQIAFLDYTKNYPKLQAIGLYPGQPLIIKAIKEEEGVTLKQLADLTTRKPATITKAIQRMEQQGYVKRKPDSKDSRIIHLHLTELGNEKYEKMIAFDQEKHRVLEEAITEEEIEILYSILFKIKKSLEKQ